jgi:DNA-binding protein YbaB
MVAMVEPNAWLADFEARAAAAKEKAAQFQESLSSAGAAASSADGLVTVTVAPNGSLADLRISDAALHGSGAHLAAEILRTARAAQRRAAGNVLTAFTALGGTDSEVTKMLTGVRATTRARSVHRRGRPLPAVRAGDPATAPTSRYAARRHCAGSTGTAAAAGASNRPSTGRRR